MKYKLITMRYILVFLFIVCALAACNKNKFTTAPQIKFKEFNPNSGDNLPTSAQPHVVIRVTDGEGDLTGNARIFIRNTFTNKIDSNLRFPNLGSAATVNFEGDVQVSLKSVMSGRDPNLFPKPFKDTIGFEIYIMDNAKNKSNVVMAQPFYFTTF